MWIYSCHGFYSIVEDRNDPETLIVRARIEGDLEKMWPGAVVEDTPDSDYRFRAALSRQEVAAGIAGSILKINFQEFYHG